VGSHDSIASLSRVTGLAACMLLFGCSRPVSHDGPCGRDISTQIRFIADGGIGHHLTTDDDTSVVRLSNSGLAETVVVYTAGAATNDTSRFFNSQDEGATWTPQGNSATPSLVLPELSTLYAPSDDKIAYRHDIKLGIYLRSIDGGRSWRQPLHAMDGKSREEFQTWLATGHTMHLNIVAIHPRNPYILYATVRLLPKSPLADDNRAYAPDRLYRSEDGGDTWAVLAEGLMNRAPMGISTSSPNLMYGIGTTGKVLRSTDGGRSWVNASDISLPKLIAQFIAGYTSEGKGRPYSFSPEYRQIFIDPNEESKVYIVTRLGIMRSTDAGKTWRLLDLGFDELSSVNSLAVGESRKRTLYVGTVHGLLISRDNGCSFQRTFPPRSGFGAVNSSH
jgi:photosystem II stability/assembly factor-like uncharacterized protein